MRVVITCKDRPMVVHILMLALLQLTCASHSGWNLPGSNSKKSFLEDAMKEMDGIESLTEPQRIPPRVIKVLVGPEHPLFRHNRHHHHRHHRHYFNRNEDLIFPPRPTKPHTQIGRIKGRENGRNRTTPGQEDRINKTRKFIHDAAFMRQAVRLLVEIKKKLKSSSVKKEKDSHLNVNKTSARPAIGLTDYQSISMLPEIRSIVQREKYNTRGARAAFAKAREILKIDKTRSLDHPPKAIGQRLQNGTKIMKAANMSSAVAVLENALQKAKHFDTVKVVEGSGTTDRVKARGEGQNQRAKGSVNATVNQRTLLSILENVKGNLTHHDGDFDAKFLRVIAHLRSLSNSSSTKEMVTGTRKESPELFTNKTVFDNDNTLDSQMKKNKYVQSGDVPKEAVNNNNSSNNNNNKSAVFKQYTEYIKAILQHESVGSNRSTKLLTEFKIPVNNKKINNNNNDDNSSKNNNSSTTTTTDNDNNNNNSSTTTTTNNNNNNNNSTNNNNSSSSNSKATALDHFTETLTEIVQHTSVRSNDTTSTTQNMGKPKVVSGKAKFLFTSGQDNHTMGVKLPQEQLASRKAFSLAMKLVKAAIAREELRKAEQELFRKMKEMMNSTEQTRKANKASKVLEQSSSAHLASTPVQDTNADSSPESATSAAAATNTEKNKKQDSESQEKYNEAAHLEENIANQQDKMYDDLVNHILDDGDGDEDEGNEEGTIRDLHREQNEDYGDFKDSDEQNQHRVFSTDQDSQNAYGSSKLSDTGGYTLRDEVVKPKAASNSTRERRRGDKIKTSLKNRIRKTPGSLKKPHRGANHEIEASADYSGTSHIHGRKHTSKHWGKRIVHRRKRKWRRNKLYTEKYRTLREQSGHHRLANHVHGYVHQLL